MHPRTDFEIRSEEREHCSFRKIVVEEELETRRKEVNDALQTGKSVKGAVKNITDYGAFIDLGGIDGLVHITDMSWGRISHPSELFNVGRSSRCCDFEL